MKMTYGEVLRSLSKEFYNEELPVKRYHKTLTWNGRLDGRIREKHEYDRDEKGYTLPHTFMIHSDKAENGGVDCAIFVATLIEKEFQYVCTKDGKFNNAGRKLNLETCERIYELYNTSK